MKILHINSYYSGSSFFKNLYDEQLSNGTKIDVYVPISNETKVHGNLGSYTKVSATYNAIDRFLFKVKHERIYSDILNHYDMKNYDVIHAHSLFSNGVIAMKLNEQYGIPYIVAVRNTDLNLFFKKVFYLRSLGVEILKKASKIVFLSEAYKESTIAKYVPEEMEKAIREKSVIIPNGIDNYWLQNKGIPKDNKNDKKVNLLYVGAVNKNKNISTTVKSLEKLNSYGYKVSLTIVGKIHDEKIYNKYKHLENIVFLGQKTKEDLLKIYRENDIFVMPSIHESFGLVYLEALSQGVPVIYSKNQGFDRHFEEGEIGYRVTPTNENEISTKIIQILNNLSEVSERCVEKVDRFSWKGIEEQYNEIYETVQLSAVNN